VCAPVSGGAEAAQTVVQAKEYLMRKVLTVLAAAALGLAVLTIPEQASAQHSARMHITALSINPPGPDHPITNHKLNAEYVVIKNFSATVRHLGGWTLRDASGHVYTFHHLRLGAGHSVVVHTGSGTNTHHDRYWGEGKYVWNNDHDTVILKNRAGHLVDGLKY
jgi:Lamin Tail Domain